MLILKDTNTKLQLVIGTGGDLEINWSAMDVNGTTFTPKGDVPTNAAGTGTVDFVPAPAGTDVRNVRDASAFNNHASNSTTLSVNITDGTDTANLWNGTLLAKECVKLDAIGRWTLYDVNGNVKAVVFPAAAQADQEAGTSNVLSVTPANQQFHPSAAKFWCKAGVTGNSLASYNVTSIGDTGTGLMTVTIATDFSSANWAGLLTIENLDASIDATTDKQIAMLGLAGQAAGTYAAICGNETGVAAADPTTWHVVGFGDQ